MTFKDLQKAIQSQAGQINATVNLQAKLQGLPFWIIDREKQLTTRDKTEDATEAEATLQAESTDLIEKGGGGS